jgi:superfamily II DNA or RNA helicase
MANFSEFLKTFNPYSKGKEFEQFVKWFLKNDPEWSTQVEQVWLWEEYSERWGRDCGVDLVFKHKNGDIWAVQAKCYSPEYSITKSDLDKFLSESNRQGIDKRLLIASTDKIGSNAKQVCNAQEKPVIHFLFSDFDKSVINYPSNLSELNATKTKKPPSPRPHQLEAINEVEKGFKEADRGQLIMACGTGKTFTTLWIKERLSAETTLVLVPSLSLLSQTLREWTFACNTSFDVLCVCSDQSVGKRASEDEIIHSVKDLPFPVTSDVQEICDFLKSNGRKVIFSTYQSSQLISESQSNLETPMFDLVIADEAHRCSGKVESEFAIVLDNQKIRANKRLFATATPRTYSVSLKRSASERGVDIASMDDEMVFGKEFYTLNFGEAIERGLLTDYQVIIVGVNDPMISEWIEKRKLVQTESGDITDAESLASQIGLIKAIKDYDLKRMISFHSKIKRAEAFASELKKSIEFINDRNLLSDSIWTDFVSGQMPAYKRRLKLEQLRKLTKGKRGLLSNARCLSEGVDVPSLDGVAFIDPRSSQADIIQAVGRAIRLSDEKKLGTVVLPVFIEDDKNAEASIQGSNFKPIWDVLNALKAHDDVLSFELDQLRTSLGKRTSLGQGSVEIPKIIFNLPVTVDRSFSNSLKTYLIEKTTSSWNFWFGLLEVYAKQEGHARVTDGYKTEDGFKLGNWVLNQRGNKRNSKLNTDQIKRLEELPKWSWDISHDIWSEGFSGLVQFAEQEGHTRIPGDFITDDGFKLGQWVSTLRRNKQDNKLNTDQIKRLEELPKWSWNLFADSWSDTYSYLLKFVQQNGHSRVPQRFKTEDGLSLGQWISVQRRKKEILTPDQIKGLEALPGWSWNPHLDNWEEGFLSLTQFVEQNGHARVPNRFKTDEGFNLGLWAIALRRSKKYNKLCSDLIMKLETLPHWSWDVQIDDWEEGFLSLTQFVEQEGHSRVPKVFKTEEGFKLGEWVSGQRKQKKKNKLNPDRIKRLEALSKWSWNMFSDSWETGFTNLIQFIEQNGHARVPGRFKSEDGFNLGKWVSSLRKRKGLLTLDKVRRLEELPKWSWNLFMDAWEEGFSYLIQFVENEGHARVPTKFKAEDGYNLGQWVSDRRRKKSKEKFTQDQIKKLEALEGWVWSAK